MSAPVKGDKLWRTLAVLGLCGLVYYLSYDQGRSSVADRAKSEVASMKMQLDLIKADLAKTGAELAVCRSAAAGPAEPLAAADKGERFTLRAGHSRLLFDNRLVVTLVSVDSLDNKAVVQFNLLEEGQIDTKELVAGASLSFSEDGQTWTLVLTSLQASAVTFTLVASKTGGER